MRKESKPELIAEDELPIVEEEYLPETRNVVQLGYAFFFIIFAFVSQGFYQGPVIKSTPSVDNRSIYNSGAIIYCVGAFVNLVSAPIVDLISAKWAMALGGLFYAIYMIGFLFLNEIYLYIASALLGIGAALVWTAQGTYLTQNSSLEKSARNSAIVWGMMQGSMFAGGIFLYVTSLGGSGGAIPPKTIRMLYGIFTGLSVAGIAISVFFPSAPAHLSPTPIGYRPNAVSLIVSPVKLLITRKLLFLLIIVFAYTGVLQYFWMNLYPAAISQTKAFNMNPTALVGLNAICAGVGECVAGIIFYILFSRPARLGRPIFVLVGAFIHLIAFVLVFINLPADANLTASAAKAYITPSIAIALVTGFLLGFGDACWNIQIFSYLVIYFRKHSSAAFAIYKFFQSALFAAAFFYAPKLQLPWHLLILVIFSILATLAFFVVERITKRAEMVRESLAAAYSE
ncbi:hypothetical protein PMAYCL1PPCAC_21681 [Pristionchus mayeri]|uniref:UNC93-like protein MFSD11 n=1 Tax=Pristionchus mayeri TaxID=1317129 RepID=A0AAN5CUZ8_9BILA|nr:hypothetical protein PMAYCL1PPCAC_21681 [Pristionchus mayeri]